MIIYHWLCISDYLSIIFYQLLSINDFLSIITNQWLSISDCPSIIIIYHWLSNSDYLSVIICQLLFISDFLSVIIQEKSSLFGQAKNSSPYMWAFSFLCHEVFWFCSIILIAQYSCFGRCLLLWKCLFFSFLYICHLVPEISVLLLRALLMNVIQQRLSSLEGYPPSQSMFVFPWRLSCIEGCIQSNINFHQFWSSMKGPLSINWS